MRSEDPESLFEIPLRTLSLDLACYADSYRVNCSLLNIMRTMARLIVKHLEQYIAATAGNSIIAWNFGYFNSDQQDSFTRLKIFHHIYSIAHMPHIDIQILAVCWILVPLT